MKFYLGTHVIEWAYKIEIPLFLSRNQLIRQKNLREAKCEWCLDSGAFTELTKYGRWTVDPISYAYQATKFKRDLGAPTWASPQDWMCEPFVLKKTGKTIEEHQRLTIESLIYLRENAKEVRFVPVLQGWEVKDYISHIAMYFESGFNLQEESTVCIGSVCRRQGTNEAAEIVKAVYESGVRNIHAFGFKIEGLKKCKQYLQSSDSMAWSLGARYEPPLPGHKHKTCANCIEYAMIWHRKVMDIIK